MVKRADKLKKYQIYVNPFEAGVLTALILKSDQKWTLKELLNQLSAIYAQLYEAK